MIKKIKTVIHIIWALFAVTSGITIGAMYGWSIMG